SYPSPHTLDSVIATASQSVAPLDHTNPSFASWAPRLGSLEPALFFPAPSLLTASVSIGNGNIFHSHGFLSLLHSPSSKTQRRLQPILELDPVCAGGLRSRAAASADRWTAFRTLHSE